MQNANFKMNMEQTSSDLIESVDLENNKIYLNQINKGQEYSLEIPIKLNDSNKFDLDNFLKENSIRLQGEFITEEAKTVKVDKEIKLKLGWTNTTDVNLVQELTKVITTDKEKIIQIKATANIENNNLPVKETSLKVQVPVLDNKKPSKVTVYADTTKATNGDNSGAFSEDNYTYDSETGLLEIKVDNVANENNEVSWEKNATDEYVITYIYTGTINEQKITSNIEANITTYGTEETINTKSINQEYTIGEDKGVIITNTTTTDAKSLSKGYIYTNTDNTTIYNVTWQEAIGYVDIVDSIIVEQSSEKFITNSGEEIESAQNTEFVSTKISKENFDKILGTKGFIKIYSANGTLIETIDKDTKLDENNNYIINYAQNTSYIKIETSKPIKEGKLEIEHTKQIIANTDYTKEQIKSFKTLQTKVSQLNYKEGALTYKHTFKMDIPLEEPSTQIESYMDKTNLSTVTTNNDVKLNVVLKSNNVQYDLYKNPVIEIELPSYVTDVNIKENELLNGEGMTIKNTPIDPSQNENKIIKVEIQGEQTKYSNDEVMGGPVLAMNLNLTLDQFTPSKEDVVKVYVSNENATNYQNQELGKAYQEIKINYVAPTGMVTVNRLISGTESAMSISGKQENMEIKAGAEAKTATVDMMIINNTNNAVKNVRIFGKVPTANNTDASTNESLGSTFTANMVSGIVAKTGINEENITVYYTQNENATKDLNNSSNGWTTNIANAKAYLIVLNNYEFKKGETIEFSYDIQIPANLKHSEASYATYAVYYNQIENASVDEVAVATKVGIVSPQGADLEVKISSNVEGQNVQEGQIIKYTVTVKNVGDNTVTNIGIKSYIPSAAVFVEKDSMGIYKEDSTKTFVAKRLFNLQQQQEETFEYEVKVKTISDIKNSIDDIEDIEAYVPYITSNATVTCDFGETTQTFETNTLINTIVEGSISLELNADKITNLSEQDEITYGIKVININDKEKTNVIVTSPIPDGTEFVEASEGEKSDENKKEIVWNIGSLSAKETRTLTLKVKVSNLSENVYEKEIVNRVSATCNETDNTSLSNEITSKVTKQGVSFTQTSNIEDEKVSAGDQITYEYTLTNIGARQISFLEIEAYTSEFVKIEKVTYSIDNTEYNVGFSDNNITININLLGIGKTAKIKIKGTIKQPSTAENVEIDSYAKIVSGLTNKIESNHITHIIESKNSNPGGPGKITNKTYKVSGTVWIDSDKNGERNDSETKKQDVRVILIDQTNGNILQDTTTDVNGKYVFEGLNNGTYMVIFIYNNEVYNITEYKKENIAENKNSDAMQVNVELDGVTMIAAATDAITIESANIYNIDLGLIEKQKFDLKLSKEISNITVQNTQGTKKYDYQDGTTIAKVDISPKYIDGTTVVITYKIKITNEGDIAGYAKNIVDYIADDVKFSSELNNSWYQGNDGNIYTTSLANTIINPGETKEVTLVVTKQMTEENIGLVINTAEIYESYNDLAVKDTDSAPANKVQSEDDYGVANIYLSISTGGVAIYAGITIIMIAIIGIGAYIIKKKVLRRV